MSPELSMDDARRLARGPYAQELHRVVERYATAIFWFRSGGDGLPIVRNATTFFVDTGRALFGVTAGHVVDQFREDAQAFGVSAQVGGSQVPFDLRSRIIQRSDELDLATYRLSAEEIAATGAIVVTGSQLQWPPKPPEIGKGILYGGFPGKDRIVWHRDKRIEFGGYSALNFAEDVTPTDIISVLHRGEVQAAPGRELPPEGYPLGGLSGGPVLVLTDGPRGLVGWHLGGVIRECLYGIAEVVRAVRADHIQEDGTIGRRR